MLKYLKCLMVYHSIIAQTSKHYCIFFFIMEFMGFKKNQITAIEKNVLFFKNKTDQIIKNFFHNLKIYKTLMFNIN